MEQIETFGKGVDEFLVLRGILAQIDFRFTVTGIGIILALAEEIGVGLVVMFVDDRHTNLVSQFPTSIQVAIARM